MAKEKATITLDRGKAAEARSLAGVSTTSAVVDLALDRLIRAERLRRDVAAYQREPATDEETAIAEITGAGDLADDTDWAALV